MKIRNLLLYGAICLLSLSFSADAQLVITGVIDGPLTSGLPKAVELYALEDIPDLSIYGLGCANNGGGSDGQEFTFLTGTAAKGQYLHVATEKDSFNYFFGFPPDTTSNVANINGDDAIELFREGSVIDVFGDINTDGTGEAWEYLDGWAYRKDGTDADGSTFDVNNWTFSGPNALDGETTNDTADHPFPIGTYEPTVAVRLAAFSAVIYSDKTVISWETSLESNCAGFFVLSAEQQNGPYNRENNSLIMAEGGAGMSREYTFEILPPQPHHNFFRLEEITVDGSSYYYPPVQASIASHVDNATIPVTTQLSDNYPNPFNSTTVITFSLDSKNVAKVHILDLNGRVICTLADGMFTQGEHQVHWRGVDDRGKEARSGVYFYRLRVGNYVAVKKMTLMR